MKFTLKKSWYSRHDYSAHKSLKLGATQFPAELLFLSRVISQDAEDCTAFSSISVRESEVLNSIFDPMQFWSDELVFSGVKTSDGFPIEVPAAVGVEKGFSPQGNPTIRQNKPSFYFWITPNNGQDWFDSIRSIILSQQRPVLGGLDWFSEYNTPDGVIQDNGKTLLGGHAIKIAGWTTKNGIPYLVLQNTWGVNVGDQGKFYMPRELVNKQFSRYGVFFWSDDPNAQIVKLGWLQALLQNVISLMRTLISKKSQPEPPIVSPIDVTPPPPAPPVVHASLIPSLAEGIFEAEGNGTQAGMKLNNRGDLKYTDYTKSLGATGASLNNFAIFPTMEKGDQACRQLCTDAALGLLKGYEGTMTISAFCAIYGEPPILSEYVRKVMKHLPTKVASDEIRTLL